MNKKISFQLWMIVSFIFLGIIGCDSSNNKSAILQTSPTPSTTPLGYYEFQIDQWMTFTGNNDIKLSYSIDYRQAQKEGIFYNLRTGPLLWKFSAPKGDLFSPLREVNFGQQKVLDPSGKKPSEILNDLRSLNNNQRAKLVRIYAHGLTQETESDDGGIPHCIDPVNINADYSENGCSFIYYLVENKKPGIYDGRTGTIILPSLDLRLINPFHASAGPYNSSKQTGENITNTLLSSVTMTTQTINSLTIPANDYKNIWIDSSDIPLVDLTKISAGDLAIPDDLLGGVLSSNQCPMGWGLGSTDSSTIGCYISPSSPFYVKGYPLTHKDETYYITVSLLLKFNPSGSMNAEGNPENIPFFMADSLEWIVIQGRLVKCGDTSFEECPSIKNP